MVEKSDSPESRKPTLKHRTEALVRDMVERGLRLEEARREFERAFISAALDQAEQNQSKAAKILGLHRNTLQSKVRLLDLNHHK